MLLCLMISACSTLPPVVIPEPMRSPRAEAPSAATPVADQASDELPATAFRATPNTAGAGDSFIAPAAPALDVALEPVALEIENLPIPAFINEVYGNILGLSFELGPGLQTKRDLITVRLTEPIAPDALYGLASRLLDSYGISVRDVGPTLRFDIKRGSASGGLPLIASGRSLPSVPASHRPVFMFVPLHVVSPGDLIQWVKKAFDGLELEVSQIPSDNTLVLQGPGAIVEQALELVRMLDQPYMRGRNTLRIEPAFLSPTQLAEALKQVLETEGYNTQDRALPAAVVVIPLDDVGAVLVFAQTADALEHVRKWTRELDQPKSADKSGSDIFFYAVKNTSVTSIAEVLDPLLNRITSEDSKPDAAGATKSKRDRSLVVDEARNALIFLGSANDWARLLPIIKNIDLPAKQVLLELTIAEITLDESETFGVEWLFNGEIGGYQVTGGTLGGTGIGGGGFSLSVVNGAGATKLVLNALAARKRVNILSSPRLLVKSGQEASIEVGTEVPIITQQSTAQDTVGGDSAILQSVQYRKTGMLISATPVVHADRQVDIVVSQELSSAQPTTTSGIDSPTILTRSVNTALTLEDGGSVMLGGIISQEGTGERRGVPGLKELPVLGALFRTDAVSSTRSEIIVLIVPYILDNSDDAEAITRAFRENMTESDGFFNRLLPRQIGQGTPPNRAP